MRADLRVFQRSFISDAPPPPNNKFAVFSAMEKKPHGPISQDVRSITRRRRETRGALSAGGSNTVLRSVTCQGSTVSASSLKRASRHSRPRSRPSRPRTLPFELLPPRRRLPLLRLRAIKIRGILAGRSRRWSRMRSMMCGVTLGTPARGVKSWGVECFVGGVEESIIIEFRFLVWFVFCGSLAQRWGVLVTFG